MTKNLIFVILGGFFLFFLFVSCGLYRFFKELEPIAIFFNKVLHLVQ